MSRPFPTLSLFLLLAFVMSAVVSCGKDDDIKTATTENASERGGNNQNDNGSATGKEPAGTAADPYCIATAADWNRWMSAYAKDTSRHFKLMAPIALTITIDTFCGRLDGCGYSITVENRPVFKVLSGAEVRNVAVQGSISKFTLAETDIVVRQSNVGNADRYFGALACQASNGSRVYSCTSSVTARLTADWSGYFSPLCGIAEKSTINGCVSSGRFSASAAYVGGIVSMADTGAVVRNCGTTATLSAATVGGIAYGVRCATVENCYVQSSLTASLQSIGGISVMCDGGVIDNCYFYGKLDNITPSLICILAAKNSVVRYCYGGLSEEMEGVEPPLVLRTSSGGTTSNCFRLFDALQLEVSGSNGSSLLVEELNARAAQLPDAMPWTTQNGSVVLMK
ncbi:MAG: hypothetical protein II793_01195 [Bacteroidales bacterium]|nr:hypothetical protein [Bacteroidales bacterium]